jgi:arginine:ornithine antiporter/lysine permease
VSVAKVLPIARSSSSVAFDPAVFAANLSGDASMPLFDQVRGTLL